MISDNCPFDIDLPGTDYSIFGDKFYTQVPVVREQAGRLFWLNADWFRSHDVDADDYATAAKIERWLLDTFSIRTCETIDVDAPQFARADRYGGIGGTAHGGSGRCVYRGRFNVKGVGRTPLVPADAATHANGQFLLVEALRGTIYAELAHLETLCGAVRTVAIIQIPPFDVPASRRRCLLIRPNFVRPAHVERSLLFGTAGFPGSDQYKDHQRVLAVREQLAKTAIDWRTMAINAAREIGSLDAVRMAQGRYTSSNMSVVGEVADFESFRIFDSWDYTKNINRDDYPFGKDIRFLINSAVSWCWLTTRRRVDRDSVGQLVNRAHKEGFSATIGNLIPSWGRKRLPERKALSDRLHKLFLESGGIACSNPDRWIVDQECDDSDYAERIRRYVGTCGFDEWQSFVIAARMMFWRRSREATKFTAINLFAENLVGDKAIDWRDTVAAVNGMVACGRRIFEYENDDHVPLFVTRSGNARLILLDVICRQFCSVSLDPAPRQITNDAATAISRKEMTEISNAEKSKPAGSDRLFVLDWAVDYVAMGTR